VRLVILVAVYGLDMKLVELLLPGDPVAMRVGQVVLAASRLEWEARMFALELAVPFKSKAPGLDDVRKGIIAQSQRFAESDRIVVWITCAYGLWAERNNLAHSIWMDTWRDDGPTPELITQRGFATLDTDLGALDDLLNRMLEATWEGIEIVNVLRRRAIDRKANWGGPFGMPEL